MYAVNYGYIADTKAPDGEELDAYVLGVDEAREIYTGICRAIIHRRDDDDDKLIVMPEGLTLSDEEIMQQVQFMVQWFDSEVLRD